jgi:hypothetical protein
MLTAVISEHNLDYVSVTAKAELGERLPDQLTEAFFIQMIQWPSMEESTKPTKKSIKQECIYL